MKNWGRLFCVRDYLADGVYRAQRQISCMMTILQQDDEKIVRELYDPVSGVCVRITIELVTEGNR